MMQVTLNGGPYDGIVLDHNDIRLYARIQPVGPRNFILLPPRKDWDAVRREEVDKNGPFDGQRAIYEYVKTQHGFKGQHDTDGSTFAEALREYSDGRQPVPQAEFTGQFFKCYRGDLSDVELPAGDFTVTDGKDRQWTCVAVSREEGESSGFEGMASRLVALLHCNDKTELSAKLTDEID